MRWFVFGESFDIQFSVYFYSVSVSAMFCFSLYTVLFFSIGEAILPAIMLVNGLKYKRLVSTQYNGIIMANCTSRPGMMA